MFDRPQVGRKPGYRPSPETRAKIGESVRAAYARGYGRRAYQPPEPLREMYNDLKQTFGATEARRLIEDHARIRKIGFD